jgi:predicted dehydrogenase
MTPDTLRLGLLGCAHIYHATSYSHALAQMPGAELAAIYDDVPERARHFAAQFGVPDVYPAPEPLLARADLDAVIVCSPTIQHAALVPAAARAGKHVLCEKPIATTLADARAIIQACESAGVQLHIAFVCRFYPMVLKAREMIRAGEIGQVRGLVGGNRGVPPLDYPEWIRDPGQAGGGALLDHSVHVTDAMRFLAGAEVASVYAEAGKLVRPEFAVEDAALLLLRFQGGAVASVDPSWVVPAPNPYAYDFFLRIVGTEGTLDIDDRRQALRVVSEKAPARPVWLEPFGVDIDAALVRHFVECVRRGEPAPPYASGLDGLRALEIALAGYESARRAAPVRLPLETS